MDVIGPISPPTSKGHRFILIITDYFSKWAEDVLLKEVKTLNVIKFIKHHVLYRFGVLAHRPITLVLMMINSCSYSTNDLVFI